MTVLHVTQEDHLNPEIWVKFNTFNTTLNDWLDDANFKISDFTCLVLEDIPDNPQVDPAYGYNGLDLIEYNTKIKEQPEEDDIVINTYDKYMRAKVILDDGNNGKWLATAKKDKQNFMVGKFLRHRIILCWMW